MTTSKGTIKLDLIRCPDCDGAGWVESENGMTACQRCDGQGKIGKDELPAHEDEQ